MEIIYYIVIGVVINLLIYRPLQKKRIREECKLMGYPIERLKWYEWFL